MIAEEPKQIVVRFFRTATGREPVKDWLASLAAEDRRTIGTDIKDVEFGWPIGMPLCRRLTGHRELWEVRSRLPGGRIARVIFIIRKHEMILLHGFEKKAQKTPKAEIDTAVKRKQEYDRHDA
jgi:phage-related protein